MSVVRSAQGWAAALLGLLLVPCGTFGQETSIEERNEAIAWYQTMDGPDVAQLRFVKITNKNNKAAVGRLSHDQFGFVVEESDETITVLTLARSTQELEKPDDRSAPEKAQKVESVSIESVANDLLKQHRDNRAEHQKDLFPFLFSTRSRDEISLFVLAVACKTRGKLKLAGKLIDASHELLVGLGEDKRLSYKEAIANRMAYYEMWDATLKFGDHKIARGDILEDFRRIEKFFPYSPYVERARSSAKLLAQMVVEDNAHQDPVAFESLSAEEKVKELIFKLRDQNGFQFSQPGSCDIFWADRLRRIVAQKESKTPNVATRKLSPAGQLVEMGSFAVPYLIEAMDDNRFTRSVTYHRDFYFSHRVLTVGDCAQRILQRITGRKFGDPYEAKSWWKRAASKTEKQLWIDAVVVGNQHSATFARRLANKYPNAALDAIAQGVSQSDSVHIRRELLNSAKDLDGSERVLRNELAEAPRLGARVAAAGLWRDWNQDSSGEATTAMIREWENLTVETEIADDVEELICYLSTCNDLAAIKSLGRNLRKRDVAIRLNVVASLSPNQSGYSVATSGGGMGLLVPDKPVMVTNKVQEQVKAILLASLADTQRRYGLSGHFGNFLFLNPRVCDFALYVLTQRFPKEYPQDVKTMGQANEGLRLEILNRWRKQRDLSPLTVPGDSAAHRLSSAASSKLLWLVHEVSTPFDQDLAFKQFEEAGPTSLPVIEQLLRELPADHVMVQKLDSLGMQFATTVVSVKIASESGRVDANVEQLVSAWKGKPLNAESLVDLNLFMTKTLPQGTSGVRVFIRRAAHGRGVQLEVLLTKAWTPQNGSQRIWQSLVEGTSHPQSDALFGSNSSSSLSLELAMTRSAYAPYIDKVDEAIKLARRVNFEIHYSLIRSQ